MLFAPSAHDTNYDTYTTKPAFLCNHPFISYFHSRPFRLLLARVLFLRANEEILLFFPALLLRSTPERRITECKANQPTLFDAFLLPVVQTKNRHTGC